MVYVKEQFQFMAARWTTETRQSLLAPISHSFPSTLVPGDGLVLDVAETHYYENIARRLPRSVGPLALITINSSDRRRKRERERDVTLTISSDSRCNETCMR